MLLLEQSWGVWNLHISTKEQARSCMFLRAFYLLKQFPQSMKLQSSGAKILLDSVMARSNSSEVVYKVERMLPNGQNNGKVPFATDMSDNIYVRLLVNINSR